MECAFRSGLLRTATRDEIAFEEKIRTFAELGFSAIQFHDDDAVPNINDYTVGRR